MWPPTSTPSPHRNTIYSCLRRWVQRDYRAQIAATCWDHVTTSGQVALVMYDLTTLHFAIVDEDQPRKLGMSKEYRVDPQVTVGLLARRRLPVGSGHILRQQGRNENTGAGDRTIRVPA